MSKLSHLKPQALWQHFEQIALIPHESANEAALRAYVASQAERLGLKHATDAAGNLIVYKPGRGEPLIIQAHLDMVCEKNQADGWPCSWLSSLRSVAMLSAGRKPFSMRLR